MIRDRWRFHGLRAAAPRTFNATHAHTRAVGARVGPWVATTAAHKATERHARRGGEQHMRRKAMVRLPAHEITKKIYLPFTTEALARHFGEEYAAGWMAYLADTYPHKINPDTENADLLALISSDRHELIPGQPWVCLKTELTVRELRVNSAQMERYFRAAIKSALEAAGSLPPGEDGGEDGEAPPDAVESMGAILCVAITSTGGDWRNTYHAPSPAVLGFERWADLLPDEKAAAVQALEQGDMLTLTQAINNGNRLTIEEMGNLIGARKSLLTREASDTGVHHAPQEPNLAATAENT